MWHEARRSEKKVHDMMDAARKRAQRRAIYLAKRRGDPQQSIQAVGSRCRIYRDDALYQATEDQQGLIPWNGKQDILIDRSLSHNSYNDRILIVVGNLTRHIIDVLSVILQI
ncbi:hypothetical protein BC332_14740 [Capsicum chinense]|nr:hypothetical protein BC332_14740 [Capsicum chinense]